jgi:coatomer subunit zeta
MNLSLYAVNAFIVLDTDGHRVMAKYYNPKSRGYLGNENANKGLSGLKEQRAFEKGLFSKTKKAGGAQAFSILSRIYTHVDAVKEI